MDPLPKFHCTAPFVNLGPQFLFKGRFDKAVKILWEEV